MRKLFTDPDDIMHEADMQAADELSDRGITQLSVGHEKYNDLHKQRMIDILNETGYEEYVRMV